MADHGGNGDLGAGNSAALREHVAKHNRMSRHPSDQARYRQWMASNYKAPKGVPFDRYLQSLGLRK